MCFLTSLMYALRRNNVNSLRTQFNSVTLLLEAWCGLVRMLLTKLIVSVVFCEFVVLYKCYMSALLSVFRVHTLIKAKLSVYQYQ